MKFSIIVVALMMGLVWADYTQREAIKVAEKWVRGEWNGPRSAWAALRIVAWFAVTVLGLIAIAIIAITESA